MILASQGIGVVLYIARVNHTPKPLIRYSLGMLQDARVLGLVMNSIEMHKISSLYYTYQYPNYAYYSNAYAYGYNYYYYGDSHGEKGHRRKPTPRAIVAPVRPALSQGPTTAPLKKTRISGANTSPAVAVSRQILRPVASSNATRIQPSSTGRTRSTGGSSRKLDS